MTKHVKIDPIPQGMHTVTPQLTCDGAADAIDFYKKAFGAVETARLADDDGKIMHAAIRIGDSDVMLVEEDLEWGALSPTSLRGSPVTMHIYVENVDAFVAKAEKAGAKIILPVADMFWGDRYGKLQDPHGHLWSVATHIRDVSRDEMSDALQNKSALE
jgi:uncharacterized glyoxalase superfamily protein PhnB